MKDKNSTSEKIDILNRQPLVDRLIELIHLIADSKSGCTFSLDGKWGSGKSFVLEMLEKQLSLFQNPETADDKYIVFHYNCWQYDFYEEPSIAIVAAIRNEIDKYNRILPELSSGVKAALETAKEIGKELIGSFLEKKLGCNLIDFADRIQNQKATIEKSTSEVNEFDSYYRFKEILDKTKSELANLAKERPVVLVVDELDRCLPNYAIKVLERLHHLFDENSNIIVLLAIDREQLNRTVQKTFGIPENDTENQICKDYFKKFIAFSIPLDSGEISARFWEKYPQLMENYDIPDDEKNFFEEFPCKLFQGIDARAQERAIERLMTMRKLLPNNSKDPAALCFELAYQAIMATSQSIKDFDIYNQKREKNNSSGVFKYLADLAIPHDSMLNYSGFSLDENSSKIMVFMIESISPEIRVELDYNKITIYDKRYYGKLYYVHSVKRCQCLLEWAQKYHQIAELIK